MNKIAFLYEVPVQEKKEIESVADQAVNTALSYIGVPYPAMVSVVLTDNSHIRTLNASARGVDAPTDVLSFPMLEYEIAGEVQPSPMDFEGKYLMLGDIVISLERAREQAAEYGHSFRREVGFLTVHSMLHLLGFDHIAEADGEVMRAKEKEILEEMRLPRE